MRTPSSMSKSSPSDSSASRYIHRAAGRHIASRAQDILRRGRNHHVPCKDHRHSLRDIFGMATSMPTRSPPTLSRPNPSSLGHIDDNGTSEIRFERNAASFPAQPPLRGVARHVCWIGFTTSPRNCSGTSTSGERIKAGSPRSRRHVRRKLTPHPSLCATSALAGPSKENGRLRYWHHGTIPAFL